jgi:hypothetical protein
MAFSRITLVPKTYSLLFSGVATLKKYRNFKFISAPKLTFTSYAR